MIVPFDDDSSALRMHMVEYRNYGGSIGWQWNVINDCDVVPFMSYLIYMRYYRIGPHSIRIQVDDA